LYSFFKKNPEGFSYNFQQRATGKQKTNKALQTPSKNPGTAGFSIKQ
jgi:hypothetical protein